jgi:hypothetical protein
MPIATVVSEILKLKSAAAFKGPLLTISPYQLPVNPLIGQV